MLVRCPAFIITATLLQALSVPITAYVVSFFGALHHWLSAVLHLA